MARNTTHHAWPFPEAGDTDYADTLDTFADTLDVDVVLKDTKTNRPAAGTADRWFLATDEPELYYDDGSSWTQITNQSDASGTISGDNFEAAQSTSTPYAYHFNDDTDTGLYRTGADALALATGGVDGIQIDASRNVSVPNGDIDDGTNKIFDAANGYVPLSILEANSVTVAGNAVTLGNSTAINHGDLSSIGAADHHNQIQISDSGSSVLTQPTDINFSTNLSVNDDGDGSLSISASGGSGGSITFTDWEWRDVTDDGVANDGSEDVSAYIENNLADNLLLIFPPGTYAFDGGVTIDNVENFGVWAPQGGVTFTEGSIAASNEFFHIGTSGNNAENIFIGGMDCDVQDAKFAEIFGQDVLIEDVEFTNERNASSSQTHHISMRAQNDDGRITLREVRMPQGGALPDGVTVDDASGGIYVFKDHAGTIKIEDCEVGPFPDNGVYASPPGESDGSGGRTLIYGGEFRNSNVSNLRIGGDGSVIRDAKIIIDNVNNNFSSIRGLYLRNGRGNVVDNVKIECDSTISGHSACRVASNCQTTYIRDLTVIDNGSNRALRTSGDDTYPIFIDGLVVKGSAGTSSVTYPVYLDRKRTHITDSHIDQPNRSGIDIVQTDCSVRKTKINVNGTGIDAGGANARIEEIDSTNTINIDAADVIVNDVDATTSIDTNETRFVENGLGTNDGDPSAGGEWNGNGYEGIHVFDTTNGDLYVYANGSFTQIQGSSGGSSTSLTEWTTIVFENTSGDYEVWNSSGSQITTSSSASTALQSGIDNAGADDVIQIRGHFNLGSQITIGNGKTLRGYNAEIEVTAASTWMIDVEGTLDNTVDITADVTAPENFVTVSDASVFSRGDIAMVQNLSETWGASNNGGNIGELHLVKNVDTTNDIIEFHDGVYYDFPSADSTQVEQYTPAEAHFEGFRMYGTDETPQGSDYRGIRVYKAKNCTFRDLTMEYLSQFNIAPRKCYGAVVEGCLIQHSINAGDGYGVRMRHGTANTLVANNRFRNVRHHVTHTASGSTNGQPRGTLVTGNISTPSEESACYDCHDGGIYWYIVGNHVQGSDVNAIESGAVETYVYSNVVKGTDLRTENEGGFYRSRGDHTPNRTVSIRNNAVKDSFRLGLIYLSDSVSYRKIDIGNNTFTDCRNNGIRLNATTCEYLSVNGNTVDNTGGDASTAFLRVESGTWNGGAFSNNNLQHWDEKAIAVDSGIGGFDHFTVDGNDFHDGGSDASTVLDFGELADGTITNNSFFDPNDRLTNVITLGTNTSQNLVRENDMYVNVTTEISDSGTSNLTTDNYVNDGTGWSAL